MYTYSVDSTGITSCYIGVYSANRKKNCNFCLCSRSSSACHVFLFPRPVIPQTAHLRLHRVVEDYIGLCTDYYKGIWGFNVLVFPSPVTTRSGRQRSLPFVRWQQCAPECSGPANVQPNIYGGYLNSCMTQSTLYLVNCIAIAQ